MILNPMDCRSRSTWLRSNIQRALRKSSVDAYRWDLTSPAVSRRNAPASPQERRLRRQYAREAFEAKEAGKKDDVGIKLEPKVYVPYDAKPGHTPRRVAVERKKQYYASQDLEKILKERNVTSEMIRTAAKEAEEKETIGNDGLTLPLNLFDDDTFENA